MAEVNFPTMGRKKFNETVAEMQKDLDAFLKTDNQVHPHQGRAMNGRAPAKEFLDEMPRLRKPKKMKKIEPRKAA